MVSSKQIYLKEDLPTWDEIYNEFYLKKSSMYKPGIQQKMDLYWKIPRKLYVLSTVCNQLNKMLSDIDYNQYLNLIRELSDIVKSEYTITDIHFTLVYSRSKSDSMLLFPISQIKVGKDEVPAVFTIDMPDGKENIFAPTRKYFHDNERLISVNKYINHELELGILIGMEQFQNYWCINSSTEKEKFWDIIRLILRDVIVYFSGDKPGWKDEKEGA
jgi:hypothetical protein